MFEKRRDLLKKIVDDWILIQAEAMIETTGTLQIEKKDTADNLQTEMIDTTDSLKIDIADKMIARS